MNVNISRHLINEMEKNYISAEYVVGEVLPMISSPAVLKIPPFCVNDEKEIIDVSDDIIQEVKAVFSNQWEIDDCIQFLLTWGILMEV